MGVADVPTKLGPDILIKTILPGLAISTAFFEPLIYPLIQDFWRDLEEFGDKLLVWFLISFAVGLFFMMCDTYIYRFLEGRKFWPGFLWKWRYRKMEAYFKNLEKELKSLVDQRRTNSKGLSPLESRILSLRIDKLASRVREFPPDYSKKNYTGRYPKDPTRFGNVLYEFEYYSFNRYGIILAAFWNHIIQVLSKEIKDELKLKLATADMCVYLCFASFLYIIVSPIALIFQKKWIFIVCGYSLPGKPIFYLFFSIIAFLVFYNLSIDQHKKCGKFIKAIFDFYREDLAKKLDIELPKKYLASRGELEKEKAFWEKYRRYYTDYDFIDTDYTDYDFYG